MSGSEHQQKSFRFSAFIPPLVIYVMSFIIPAMVMGIPTMVLGWSKDYLFSHLYVFGTLGQMVMDLPALVMFTRLRMVEKGSNRTRDRLISLGVGLGSAMVLAGIRIALAGRLMGGTFMGGVPAFTQSLALLWPWNVIAASLAVLAYGPGEAIFVVYLIIAFDKATGSQRPVFSWGVVLTACLWALPHIFNVFFYGWSALPNVLLMVFIGLAMGLLLKGTRSSLGPMIFWTLVNGTAA